MSPRQRLLSNALILKEMAERQGLEPPGTQAVNGYPDVCGWCRSVSGGAEQDCFVGFLGKSYPVDAVWRDLGIVR
jgi:hypothetical protein